MNLVRKYKYFECAEYAFIGKSIQNIAVDEGRFEIFIQIINASPEFCSGVGEFAPSHRMKGRNYNCVRYEVDLPYDYFDSKEQPSFFQFSK